MSKYKKLMGFAFNIAQKFACSAEHFAAIACLNNEPVVEINLMSGEITPGIFNIERNRILVSYCMDNLQYIIKTVNPVDLNTAMLVCRFGIEKNIFNKAISNQLIADSIFTVTLIDDKNRKWKGCEINRLQMLSY